MGKRTPLFAAHLALNARMVDFCGWEMPLHYGSQLEEHRAVRTDAGVFDVSHMTLIELAGPDARACLDRLLANDINRQVRPGRAMYSAMLNEAGGILDDLIVYDDGDAFLIVANCATREKDLAWMSAVAADFDCRMREPRDLAILAVQGPEAIEKTGSILSSEQREDLGGLKPFQGVRTHGWFIARTGYTGESGYEIILPGGMAEVFFRRLLDAGVKPVGLGARDTLRLEAGMNLYGSDMDETVSPLQSNLSGTVFLEGRDFIGARALLAQLDAGVGRQLVGLVMTGRGVLRAHHPVFRGDRRIGEVTSGAFSPTLRHAIALARVADDVVVGDSLTVEIRGKRRPASVVKPPFVRNGRKVFEGTSD